LIFGDLYRQLNVQKRPVLSLFHVCRDDPKSFVILKRNELVFTESLYSLLYHKVTKVFVVKCSTHCLPSTHNVETCAEKRFIQYFLLFDKALQHQCWTVDTGLLKVVNKTVMEKGGKSMVGMVCGLNLQPSS